MKGHQRVEDWMGAECLTLADLWPADTKAVIVGINPAPVSVEAGHYYQGSVGRNLFRRLGQTGVLESNEYSYDDDAAVAHGIGFTDIVKRPTARASEIAPEEFRFGRFLLEQKLEAHGAELVIFTFKKTAELLLGRFAGNGFLPDRVISSSKVFVMPGPYEAVGTVNKTLASLQEYWAQL